MTKSEALKRYFGHTEFRQGQEGIVDCLLSGRDALCVMPTGAGKSVCYQIPALLLEGMTVVISPLISLMKDQVSALTEAGIDAACLNSSLSAEEYRAVLRRANAGGYRILYVAPERLEVDGFRTVCENNRIALVAVDEAHCVSQWGQDFRPGYLRIADFLNRLPDRPPVGAFTATATEGVRRDIARLLGLRNPLAVTTGFDRPNLRFAVLEPNDRNRELLRLLSERRNRSGIIYCGTRNKVDEVCRMLTERGYPATRYHAGLTDAERLKNQEAFVFDRRPIMVATNAFGMGIDKSNVSYVIHYQMPKDIESYYQEAGRAGRDGSDADCILLYSSADVHLNRFLIEHGAPNPDLTKAEEKLLRRRDQERLKQMTFYATSDGCLRAFLLRYFGEKAPDFCGNCSNCEPGAEAVDITREAQMILSCILRTGSRYGMKMIADILRGSRNERLLSLGLDRQSTYGLLRDKSVYEVNQLISALIRRGFLSVSEGEYPVLMTEEKSRAILFGKERLSVKLRAPRLDKKTAKGKKNPAEKTSAGHPLAGDDLTLYQKLREVRSGIAAKLGVPAYIIFTDATLADMARRRPKTPEEFLAVSGVGETKRKHYAAGFLAAIATFRPEEGYEPRPIPFSSGSDDREVFFADLELD